MYISIDETGSFREGKDLEYGLITLVSITDLEWEKLKLYLSRMYPKGWGKLKGSNINYVDRSKLIKYIGKKHEIKYTTLLFDLNFGTDERIEYHRSGQLGKLDKCINSLSTSNGHPNLINDLEVMRRRLNSMSKSDYTKFILIYELYREWMQYYQFDFININQKNDTWDLKHRIDNQSRAGNFKTILEDMLTLTTSHLNPDYIPYSPIELKDKNHPFETKHSIVIDGHSAIDGHKIFNDLKISNEQDDPVLLLPDLIGNTIHKSIKFRKQKVWLKLLRHLSSNRSLVMNNRHRSGKNNYYLVRGFNIDSKESFGNRIIQEHWELMNQL